MQQIAANDYKQFGILLLNDHNGSQMRIMEREKPNDPVGITTSVFETWLQGEAGEGPRTWRTLVKCLQGIKQNTLADDITNMFTTLETNKCKMCYVHTV